MIYFLKIIPIYLKKYYQILFYNIAIYLLSYKDSCIDKIIIYLLFILFREMSVRCILKCFFFSYKASDYITTFIFFF